MKIKNILFSIVCFLLLGTVNAASVEFTNYPTTVKKGEEFEVRLVIKDANDLKYVKTTNYRFDNDKIEVIDYDTLSNFVGFGADNNPYTSFNNQPGFAMKSTNGRSGNVEVLYIKYKVKNSVQAGDLIHIRMDEVFISANADGSNPVNISNPDGYCITIRVTDGGTVVENPKCEYKNNKYYDNNGNVVTKSQYERLCGTETPKCKIKDGKYYDNNGNVVTKSEYERLCGVETPKCKIKDGKYYDNNGNVVTKAVYEEKCGNPETGVNSTIVIVIAGTLLAIGCYAFFKKNKMYY